ncbi:hypothetical protein MMC13_000830 [Lambiella insularis]|nr:hypothetical protein [Lambiella insularis]
MLEEAVTKAQADYTAANPLSFKSYQDACQHMPGGNTRTVLHSSPFPLTFQSGARATLTSLDGHQYVDFLGEYTAGIYGHNNATIRAAIDEALSNGWNLGGSNVYEKRLAKMVSERFAPTMELVRFTNSGTEANMCAIATAMAWTGRKKVLVFSDGYHGSTIGFSASAESMNLPHEWVIGTYNDVAETATLLEEIPPESLAAILVEPMLGSGGGIPGSAEFLRYLRHTATECGALLVFDEVMTSRLSYRGLGHKLGIRPDLMTLGKWVGGGMSFGAFGGRRDVMEMFDPRTGNLRHAGTFNNNVVSMAAGCAGCRILDENKIDRLNDMGERFRHSVEVVLFKHGLGEATTKHSSSSDYANGGQVSSSDVKTARMEMWISGIGSILVIHFGGTGKDLFQVLFFHHMLQESIYLAQRVFMALSIEITIQDIEHFVLALERFVMKYKSLISNVGF